MKPRLTEYILMVLVIGLSISTSMNSCQRQRLLKAADQDARSLKEKDKAIGRSIDSIQLLKYQALQKDNYWTSVVLSYQDSLRVTRASRIKKEVKYENSFIQPPPPWDKPALDSIMDALIAHRRLN